MTSDALAERPDGALTTSAASPLTVSSAAAAPIVSSGSTPTAEPGDPTTSAGSSAATPPIDLDAPMPTTDSEASTAPAASGTPTTPAGSATPTPPARSRTAWRVRPARPGDVRQIHSLVQELADYEREPDAVKAVPEDFGAAFFNPHPRVHCHVVEVDTAEGSVVVGLAIWFVTFSTWRGRHGLWLEDLYVQPDYRRLGVGRALLTELAAICADRGYARMEWWVLDWNEPAHHFYRSVGAEPQDDWTVWRVTDTSLKALGDRTK